MGRGLALFIARLVSNKYRKTFMAELGATLILAKLGIVDNKWVSPLNWLIRCFLGLFVESGVFLIDLSMDALREGMKLREFNKKARLAYERATKKVYDEHEKEEIRQEYLRLIALIGHVGNPTS